MEKIDIVSAHNLTSQPWTLETIMGEQVRVETDVEIVAKKMWHRGHQATARDLFDLTLVIKTDAVALAREAKWLVRHRELFLQQIKKRRDVLQTTFEAIARLPSPRILVPDYDECAAVAKDFLQQI